MELPANNTNAFPSSCVNSATSSRWSCCRKKSLISAWCFWRRESPFASRMPSTLLSLITIMPAIIEKLVSSELPLCTCRAPLNWSGRARRRILLLILTWTCVRSYRSWEGIMKLYKTCFIRLPCFRKSWWVTKTLTSNESQSWQSPIITWASNCSISSDMRSAFLHMM